MSDEVDFVVTDYLQRLETFAIVARRTEASAQAAVTRAEAFASAVLVPVCGKAIQKRGSVGVNPGGVLMQKAGFRFEAMADIKRATIVGWMPIEHGKDVVVTATCGRWSAHTTAQAGTPFQVVIDLEISAGSEHEFKVELSSGFQRSLGCILKSVEFS